MKRLKQQSKLLSWFADRKITLADSIEVRPGSKLCTEDGLGVYATRDIAEGEVLCVIPKSSILSTRNTSLSELLQKHRLGGGLGLVLAVVHELGLRDKSPW